MKHRLEIDGLRALAVVPVILFHAAVPGFAGGFIGVDIFFVISGYLITTILLTDLQSGRFSIWDFYERRARRIVPALIFVVACTLPFAWLWMLPSQLIDFGKSLVSVATFSSNVFFWRTSGYFTPASELKPLLHTWSLAVEEQYYLLFPIALLAVWRFARRFLILTLLVCLVASLALAEWATQTRPTASFYLAPTRFWEILVGAVCAALMNRRHIPRNDIAALAGLGLILGSLCFFDDTTPTPSLWTAIPVAGTALIIAFGTQGALVARLLSVKELVGIGLISYSAYLWHQPLLALARIRLADDIPPLLLCALLAATFVMAWVSWRFVEPMRRARLPRAGIFGLSAAAFAGTLGVGATLVAVQGLPNRLSPAGVPFADLATVEANLAANTGLDPSCDAVSGAQNERCRTGPSPTVALWGDSYAMHLAQALQESPTHADFAQITLSSCGPFPGIAIRHRGSPQRCIEFNDKALAWIVGNDDIKTVVLGAAYSPFEFPAEDREGREIPRPALENVIVSNLKYTYDTLRNHNKRVVVVAPPPKAGENIGRCYLRQNLLGVPENCNFRLLDRTSTDREIDSVMSNLARFLPVIRLSDFLCTEGMCQGVRDGLPIYRDGGHLSRVGSASLGRRFDLMKRSLHQ